MTPDPEDVDIAPLDLAALDAEAARLTLPGWLTDHVVGAPPDLAPRLSALMAAWPDAEIDAWLAALREARETFAVHPAHPRCLELARVWARTLVAPGRVDGAEHLSAALSSGRPVVVVSNHLAYYDTPATDEALVQAGHEAMARRLVALAGPKVYGTVFRTIITTMVSTVSAAQSLAVRSGPGGARSLREVVRQVRRSVALSRELVADGHALLLYPEGTRSRSLRLQPFLRGAARYAEHDCAWLVPVALSGTERVMPVGSPRLTPSPVSLRFGAPIAVTDEPRAALEATWRALAELLPAHLQPAPGTPPWR